MYLFHERYKCVDCGGLYIMKEKYLKIDILWMCSRCGKLRKYANIDPALTYYPGCSLLYNRVAAIWAVTHYA